ncbi:cytochrome c family protein [candidate division KSB1 bacterium]|nr:cytochrome c family protein [candidate division KSB1 bacterium]
MLPLEAWEMVLVQTDFFNTSHGKMPCVACHSGNPAATDKNLAHAELIARPDDKPEVYCLTCHREVVNTHAQSLHANLAGYFKRIEERLGYSIQGDPNVMQKFNAECGKCHASCGQCHIQRPVSVKGGFTAGHTFKRTPSMTDNCTACHGSRVGAEYFGENSGQRADVHWTPKAKRCVFCHEASEMHGAGPQVDYRLANNTGPKCETCHAAAVDANQYHQIHWSNANLPNLACQVCHSQDYKNCNACHTGGAGITGSSYLKFKIAKNYLKSTDRPYDYVCVRHIPIAPDTYASWGIASLPHYDAEPTWKYATPHNIQRWTARTDTTGNASCFGKCHKSDYYLKAADLQPYEVTANQSLLMPTTH